ncbi:MAG: Mrr restriction system protein [candidate division Zixibacteria bacterium]|nr:Mrr restriction system protein [candidate division Zixibacteria bacterium]
MKSKINRSRTQTLATELVYVALTALKDSGGSLPRSRVFEEVALNAKLDNWAKERYEKTTYLRWRSILQFYSIALVKSGFLIKRKGTWYLTPEGEKALNLGKEGLIQSTISGYKEWKIRNKKEFEDGHASTEDEQSIPPTTSVDQVEQEAIDGIKQYISNKNPYEFQDLVAALLRGMGYYTPFVAPKGKDGGVDILAYQDAFGIKSPRIKVQVKHREQAATVKHIRELIGVLQKEGDVGIFVSSGGFTADAVTAATNSHAHIELIDIDKFISLWQEFFKKLADEDKNLLSLVPVYFLAPTE